LPSTPSGSVKHLSEPAGASCDELLVLIAAGQVAAFEALYRREMPSVRALSYRLLRNRHQADEVAQEVLLHIWQRAGQFDPALGGGRAWILRMTRCRAIDRIRLCENARVRDQTYIDLNLALRTDSVTDTVLCHLDTGRVQLALLEVSVIQREALVLAFFSRLAYPQIAAHLGIPLPTFKTRIRDALLKLRAVLDADGDHGQQETDAA